MPVQVKSGRLNRRITIEAKTTAQDKTGEPVETWSAVRQLWAERKYQRAGERFEARQTVAEVEAIFMVLFNPTVKDLSPDLHRIVDQDGRIYNITGVTEVGYRELLEITGIARAEQGGAEQNG